jgi:hypothetical protein
MIYSEFEEHMRRNSFAVLFGTARSLIILSKELADL